LEDFTVGETLRAMVVLLPEPQEAGTGEHRHRGSFN
jgi:hypothetical protein